MQGISIHLVSRRHILALISPFWLFSWTYVGLFGRGASGWGQLLSVRMCAPKVTVAYRIMMGILLTTDQSTRVPSDPCFASSQCQIGQKDEVVGGITLR